MIAARPLRTGLLILQPTPFCNIDCRYCYLPDRHRTDRMPMEVVSATMANLSESGLLSDNMTAVWHAGEPLVLPADYFAEAFELVSKYSSDDLTIDLAVQSNLTLLNAAHCEVFKEFDVSVGVSIDGPRALHDSNRVTRGGTGTFDAVMEGVELLRSRGLDFNVICVLTAASLEHPVSMYRFFRDLGARDVGFNIEELEGVNTDTSIDSDTIERRFGVFMRRFFEMLVRDDHLMNVREFRHFHELLRSGRPVRLNNQADPFAIVSVAVDGSFSTFSPELLGQTAQEFDGFTLGNVLEGSVLDVMSSTRYQNIAGQIAAGVDACASTCGYFRFCGGGAPSNKYFENGQLSSTETTFCRLTRKVLADAFIETLESCGPRAARRG
ncbi:MAG: GRRM system radical SAM/SPASM domain protein [Dehalococcoidia bacterium]|nr:GRRM system radical SAM/SPASM domain protein [Dehalococcoidia bacterium]